MKKLWTVLFFCSFAAVSLQAQIILKLSAEPEEKTVSEITVFDDGALQYSNDEGKTHRKVSRELYDYAWIPMPEKIAEADKLLEQEPEKAIPLYQECYETYKYLGWDVYCIMKEAEALSKTGKTREAIDRLEQLARSRRMDPRLALQIIQARMLLVQILLENDEAERAGELLNEMSRSGVHKEALFAFMKRAELLEKAGRKKTAAVMYCQALMLFPLAPDRPFLLWKISDLLTQLDDPRAENFTKLLNRDFPGWKPPEQE